MFAGGFQNPGRAVQFNGPAEECQEDGRNGPPYLSAAGNQSEAAYKRQMTVAEISYR